MESGAWAGGGGRARRGESLRRASEGEEPPRRVLERAALRGAARPVVLQGEQGERVHPLPRGRQPHPGGEGADWRRRPLDSLGCYWLIDVPDL